MIRDNDYADRDNDSPNTSARKYLPSGRESNFPDKISLNPLMVSSNCTKRPPDDSNSDDSDYDDSMIVIMMVQKNYHPHPNVHHSFSSS